MDFANMSPEEWAIEDEFITKLRANELTIPNIFTVEMGKQIKKAREEKGINQSQLAEVMSRTQASVSDLENGKTEIGILTIVLLSRVFNKPISFFIPKMSFLATVNDVHNSKEEEALTLFRELTYIGNDDLAIQFLKLLVNYTNDEVDRIEHPEKYLE